MAPIFAPGPEEHTKPVSVDGVFAPMENAYQNILAHYCNDSQPCFQVGNRCEQEKIWTGLL
jgi:hypothetical protein